MTKNNYNYEPDFVCGKNICGDLDYMPPLLDILERAFVEVGHRLPNLPQEFAFQAAIAVFEKAMDLEIAGKTASALGKLADLLNPDSGDGRYEVPDAFWREIKMIRTGNVAPATDKSYDEVMRFLKGDQYIEETDRAAEEERDVHIGEA